MASSTAIVGRITSEGNSVLLLVCNSRGYLGKSVQLSDVDRPMSSFTAKL